MEQRERGRTRRPLVGRGRGTNAAVSTHGMTTDVDGLRSDGANPSSDTGVTSPRGAPAQYSRLVKRLVAGVLELPQVRCRGEGASDASLRASRAGYIACCHCVWLAACVLNTSGSWACDRDRGSLAALGGGDAVRCHPHPVGGVADSRSMLKHH